MYDYHMFHKKSSFRVFRPNEYILQLYVEPPVTLWPSLSFCLTHLDEQFLVIVRLVPLLLQYYNYIMDNAQSPQVQDSLLIMVLMEIEQNLYLLF